jgi:hypothetical protein
MSGRSFRAERVLRFLLAINAVATLLAAGVLALAPAAIPNAVGIDFYPSQSLVAYRLAAAEVAMAALCLSALKSGQRPTVEQAVAVLIVFHASSAVAGLVAVARGASPLIVWNVGFRAAMIAALASAAYTTNAPARGEE